MDTLCWKCQNAVPTDTYGCNWSRNLKPVTGWIADKDKNSVCVVHCPEFIETKKEKTSTDEDAAYKALGFAIATQCVTDYRFALTNWLMHEEVYSEALRMNRERHKLNDFMSSMRRRYGQYTDKEVFDLIHTAYMTLRDGYLAYKPDAYEAIRVKHTIDNCERFFGTEEFMLYSEMDGKRVRNIIRKSVKEELGVH